MAAVAGVLWLSIFVKESKFSFLLEGGEDRMTRAMGWVFFRNAAWSFPLGSTPNLMYPIGTSVAYTDSFPWVATFFKLISSLLPANFQYFGWWSVTCYALQGFVGSKIMRLFSNDPLHQLLGAGVLIGSPALFYRVDGPLAAQWTMLLVLLCQFDTQSKPGRQAIILLLVNLFCAGIVPYLWAMIYVLTLGWAAQALVTRRMPSIQVGVFTGVVTGLSGLVMWAFGYFAGGVDRKVSGFGDYSADLLTIFNSMGTSRFMPALPRRYAQYEGFAYLGAGVLFLSGAALIGLVRNRQNVSRASVGRVLWVFAPAAAMAVYAASSRITVAGHLLLDVARLYAPFESVTNSFRASGRFVLALHYFIACTALRGVVRSFPRQATAMLAIAMAIQLGESRPLEPSNNGATLIHAAEPQVRVQMLRAAEWELIKGDFEHLARFPADIGGAALRCGHEWYPEESYARIAYKAYELKLTYNGGRVARLNTEAGRKICDSWKEAPLDDRTVYIVHERVLEPFVRQLGGRCTNMEGEWVCVSSGSKGRFRDFIEATGIPSR
jgi:hypothetical protein